MKHTVSIQITGLEDPDKLSRMLSDAFARRNTVIPPSKWAVLWFAVKGLFR